MTVVLAYERGVGNYLAGDANEQRDKLLTLQWEWVFMWRYLTSDTVLTDMRQK